MSIPGTVRRRVVPSVAMVAMWLLGTKGIARLWSGWNLNRSRWGCRTRNRSGCSRRAQGRGPKATGLTSLGGHGGGGNTAAVADGDWCRMLREAFIFLSYGTDGRRYRRRRRRRGSEVGGGNRCRCRFRSRLGRRGVPGNKIGACRHHTVELAALGINSTRQRDPEVTRYHSSWPDSADRLRRAFPARPYSGTDLLPCGRRPTEGQRIPGLVSAGCHDTRETL